jgi:signal transduction histidine kinase
MSGDHRTSGASWPMTTVRIGAEQDVVIARQRARQIAGLLGFPMQDQARIAAAVSEIARNAFAYGGGGRVEFVAEASPGALLVRVVDGGGGIPHLDKVLAGRYRSATGMGLGILGARRLMDSFEITVPAGGGTVVALRKLLPRTAAAPSAALVVEIAASLAQQAPLADPLEELRTQNRELLQSLEDQRAQQEELRAKEKLLEQTNAELEDTNRGVVALYAELDQKAEELRTASEMKSRFLSHMSHEFRTPLNSVIALTRLLLDRVDGPLTEEQEKQVGYIQKSALSLRDMVNDLLDLAKVEAGKTDVTPHEFTVAELFGGLRGVLRPLLASETVDLVFEEPPPGIPPLCTDEAKLAQILRNLISNALKFTERGEVRVSAAYDAARSRVTFTVRDTGIGIAPENQDHVFQEFSQIANPLQARTKGTGLGLPLSKRLTELLGGTITLQSRVGVGSTFAVDLPLVYAPPEAAVPDALPSATPWPGSGRAAADTPDSASPPRPRLLVIDDEPTSRYVLRQACGDGGRFAVIEAGDGAEGLRRAREDGPVLIFLDLRMPGLNGFDVLRELVADPATRGIKVVIVTSSVLDAADRERLAPAAAVLSKDEVSRERMAGLLADLVPPQAAVR